MSRPRFEYKTEAALMLEPNCFSNKIIYLKLMILEI
jgi:hypothetical protein